ncbi:MAG TPA: SDR family NAD(P)-dependent oxidoreductase, partial [Pirellulales bacterium]|nr:SDR family NAD(P)-dependent oxidoreductase [Pirellulales bacterium]
MKNPAMAVGTGDSVGVGRATVREFARREASSGLLARGDDGLRAVQHEVEALAGRAVVVLSDLADPAGAEAAASGVEQQLGPIDVWVNDAIASVFSPFVEMMPEELRRAAEVTYLGFVCGV